jgi:hypothetical protein
MSRVKYLWAAALVALCVGVFAGAALAAAPSWSPTANTIPSELRWDENAAASVTATNDGLVTWDSTYSIESVLGSGAGAAKINRWGLTSVPVTGLVVTDGSFTWDFSVTAPPITTLNYPGVTPTHTSVSATVPAVVASFDNNWDLGISGALQTSLPTVTVPVSIHRFSDVPANHWALVQIEECAGRVPAIVGGYDDGTYRPNDANEGGVATNDVNRGAMAVYIQRALDLNLAPYTKNFSDVAASDWDAQQIQALVDSGIVLGYPDNTYRPNDIVNRGQMAVYIARGMAGGAANVTSPKTIVFTDVVPTDSPGFPFYDGINYCFNHSVVGGYTATTYAPENAVSRGQMAVFIYRGFIQPTGAAVVLAGPAVTSVDPATAGYDGWTSIGAAGPADPAFAYIGLDGVRMQGLSQVSVKFELRNALTPTVPAVGAYTTTVNVNIAQALADVIAGSGNPYAYASWDIPVSTLAPDDYELFVSVNGDLLARNVDFTVGP